LLVLYEKTTKEGEEVDRYSVGALLGLHTRGIDRICRDLAQTNFIKKGEDPFICLTPNGERLVQELFKEDPGR